MSFKFEQYENEGRAYLKDLARQLGHPGEEGRTLMIVRSVLQALRDRIQLPQSLHLLAQLPVFLKILYIEGWKYRESPLQGDTLEQFADAVKVNQLFHGETQFDWPEHTGHLVTVVLQSLRRYVDEGQLQDIIAELPADIKQVFEEGTPGGAGA